MEWTQEKNLKRIRKEIHDKVYSLAKILILIGVIFSTITALNITPTYEIQAFPEEPIEFKLESLKLSESDNQVMQEVLSHTEREHLTKLRIAAWSHYFKEQEKYNQPYTDLRNNIIFYCIFTLIAIFVYGEYLNETKVQPIYRQIRLKLNK